MIKKICLLLAAALAAFLLTAPAQAQSTRSQLTTNYLNPCVVANTMGLISQSCAYTLFQNEIQSFGTLADTNAWTGLNTFADSGSWSSSGIGNAKALGVGEIAPSAGNVNIAGQYQIGGSPLNFSNLAGNVTTSQGGLYGATLNAIPYGGGAGTLPSFAAACANGLLTYTSGSVPVCATAIPNGVTAITQAITDSSTKIETTGGAWAKFPAINILQNGADPTGSADSTLDINAALTSIASSGGKIVFPCGTFKISGALTQSLAAGKHLDVAGGGIDCTIIRQTAAANGFSITYGSALSSVSFHDFTLVTDNAGGFTAINLIGTGNAQTAGDTNNSFYNLFIHGTDYPTTNNDYWSRGIYLNDVSQSQINNVTVFGSANANGVGIDVNGNSASAYSFVINVSNSFFALGFAGIYLENYWQGLSVVNTNFGGNIGIDQIASAAGVPAQLLISTSQFNCATDAVSLQSTVLDTAIFSSLILLQNNSSFAVSVIAPQTGLIFSGNVVNGTGNLGFGLSFSNAANLVGSHISHNTFNAINASLTTGTGTYDLSVDKNKCTGGTVCYSINTTGSGIVIDDTSNPHTVSTLPTASAAINGSQAIVTDATSPTYNGALTGGGSVYAHVVVTGGVWHSQ